MFNKGMVVAACMLLAVIAGSAVAGDVTVTVDGKSKPWDMGINPNLYYGISGPNGKPPTYVLGIRLLPGTKLKLVATGSTATVVGGENIGPGGDKTFVTDGRYGNPGAFFPSRYFDKASYPAYLNELVGAFVDADGVVIGKPFPIGDHAEVTIPHGAVSLSLGINDDNLNDNSGKIELSIHFLEATVTGEEVKP